VPQPADADLHPEIVRRPSSRLHHDPHRRRHRQFLLRTPNRPRCSTSGENVSKESDLLRFGSGCGVHAVQLRRMFCVLGCNRKIRHDKKINQVTWLFFKEKRYKLDEIKKQSDIFNSLLSPRLVHVS